MLAPALEQHEEVIWRCCACFAIALTEKWQLLVRNAQEGFMATGVTSDT
eukprot:COSAG03_NODE_27924_length_244_cov_1.882759_1_plen_48_part_10